MLVRKYDDLRRAGSGRHILAIVVIVVSRRTPATLWIVLREDRRKRFRPFPPTRQTVITDSSRCGPGERVASKV